MLWSPFLDKEDSFQVDKESAELVNYFFMHPTQCVSMELVFGLTYLLIHASFDLIIARVFLAEATRLSHQLVNADRFRGSMLKDCTEAKSERELL